MSFNKETVGVASQLVGFGKAIEALNEGKRVCREGWNSKGMFVFRQVPSSIPIEFVPKMSSLPQSVKDEFKRRKENNMMNDTHLSIKYSNQLALVKPNNEINGWSPSTADSLADDWVILD